MNKPVQRTENLGSVKAVSVADYIIEHLVTEVASALLLGEDVGLGAKPATTSAACCAAPSPPRPRNARSGRLERSTTVLALLGTMCSRSAMQWTAVRR